MSGLPASERTPLFLAGFPKCGSSSLFDLLAGHPAVTPSFRKETWVLYPAIWERRAATERELHAVESVFAQDGGTWAMEGSPCNVYAPRELIVQLRERWPATKVLAVIRDPTERLRSAYEFSMSLGSLDPATPFADFVASNIDGFRRRPSFRPGVAPSFHLWSSDFASHLEPWIEAFGSNIGVGRIESFAAATTRSDLARWLDVSEADLGDLPRSNVTRGPAGRGSWGDISLDGDPATTRLSDELDEIAADIEARTSALLSRTAATTFGMDP